MRSIELIHIYTLYVGGGGFRGSYLRHCVDTNIFEGADRILVPIATTLKAESARCSEVFEFTSKATRCNNPDTGI
jgi:hypothetical protein